MFNLGDGLTIKDFWDGKKIPKNFFPPVAGKLHSTNH